MKKTLSLILFLLPVVAVASSCSQREDVVRDIVATEANLDGLRQTEKALKRRCEDEKKALKKEFDATVQKIEKFVDSEMKSAKEKFKSNPMDAMNDIKLFGASCFPEATF